jgi:hypothetical protein
MPVYKDYICPQENGLQYVSQILSTVKYVVVVFPRLMSRQPGEYRICPVDDRTFTRWVDCHPDYHHPIQYANKLLVAVVMYPPHDRSSSIIIQEVKAEIDRMCVPGRARLSAGTGCIRPF